MQSSRCDKIPVRVAEQRSKRGSRPRGLSEWRAQTQLLAQQYIRATSSAAARVCEQRREARRADELGAAFFAYFLCRSKESRLPSGNPRLEIATVRRTTILCPLITTATAPTCSPKRRMYKQKRDQDKLKMISIIGSFTTISENSSQPSRGATNAVAPTNSVQNAAQHETKDGKADFNQDQIRRIYWFSHNYKVEAIETPLASDMRCKTKRLSKFLLSPVTGSRNRIPFASNCNGFE